MEACLDTLTHLVNRGWRLLYVELMDSQGQAMLVPVEIVNGTYFSEPFERLQREWEQLLVEN